jgi:hypothetical protein
MFPHMSDEQVQHVCAAMQEVAQLLQERGAVHA